MATGDGGRGPERGSAPYAAQSERQLYARRRSAVLALGRPLASAMEFSDCLCGSRLLTAGASSPFDPLPAHFFARFFRITAPAARCDQALEGGVAKATSEERAQRRNKADGAVIRKNEPGEDRTLDTILKRDVLYQLR